MSFPYASMDEFEADTDRQDGVKQRLAQQLGREFVLPGPIDVASIQEAIVDRVEENRQRERAAIALVQNRVVGEELSGS